MSYLSLTKSHSQPMAGYDHSVDKAYMLHIDQNGMPYAKNQVWDPDALAWVAMSQVSVTVGELTVSGVAISNWPTTKAGDFQISNYDILVMDETNPDDLVLTYSLNGTTVATKHVITDGSETTVTIL